MDWISNSPVGGGPTAGAGGMGNYDARSVQGVMGMVKGAVNQGVNMVQQNEYGAKVIAAGEQVAGQIGFGQQPGGAAYGSADGVTQVPGGIPAGLPTSNMGGYPGMQGGQGQPAGWGGEGGGGGDPQQMEARSSMPNKIKVEAGEYEAKIIDDLCEPSGARPNPSKETLAKFIKQTGPLNADLVCALLEEKLEDEDWKVCTKALAGIEALVKAKKVGVVEYYAEGNDELIKEISVDPESQKALSSAALRCLKAFEAAMADPVADNGMADMFSGMMTMDETPAADPMGFGGAPAPAAGGMDLSFMGNMGGPVTLEVPTMGDLLAGFGAPMGAPAPAPTMPDLMVSHP